MMMLNQDVLNSGTGWDRPHPESIGFEDVRSRPFDEMVTPHQQLWWLYARCVHDQRRVDEVMPLLDAVKDIQDAIDGMRKGSLKDYYEGILSKWMQEHADAILREYATFVWPTINKAGYYVVHVPDGWSDVRFFVEANADKERYGRLAISYDTPDTLPGEEVWFDDSATKPAEDKDKPLAGLKIAVLGDSLFSGVNTSPLATYLTELGAQADNLATNGATLAAKDRSGSGQTGHNSIYEQSWMLTDHDIVIVDGQNNDYEFADVDQIPFGTYLGTSNTSVPVDTTTFCGALEQVLDTCLTKGRKVIWTIAYRMMDEPNVLPWSGKTAEGHTLADYEQTVLRACQDYGAAIVRLDHTSLNGKYPDQRRDYFAADADIVNKSWANDGVHPGRGAMTRYILPAIVTEIRRVAGLY